MSQIRKTSRQKTPVTLKELQKMKYQEEVTKASVLAYKHLFDQGFRFCIEIKWDKEGQSGRDVTFSMPPREPHKDD
jgi:hypothetical protein